MIGTLYHCVRKSNNCTQSGRLRSGFGGIPTYSAICPELTRMGTKGVERESVQVGDRLSGRLKVSSSVLKVRCQV